VATASGNASPLQHGSPGGLRRSPTNATSERPCGQRVALRRLGQPRLSDPSASVSRRLSGGGGEDYFYFSARRSSNGGFSTSPAQPDRALVRAALDVDEDCASAAADEESESIAQESASPSSSSSAASDEANLGSPLLESDVLERMPMSVMVGGGDRHNNARSRGLCAARVTSASAGASQASATASPFLDLTIRRRRDPNDMGVDHASVPGDGEEDDEAAHLYRRQVDVVDQSSTGAAAAVDLSDEAEHAEPGSEDVLLRLDRLKRLDAAGPKSSGAGAAVEAPTVPAPRSSPASVLRVVTSREHLAPPSPPEWGAVGSGASANASRLARRGALSPAVLAAGSAAAAGARSVGLDGGSSSVGSPHSAELPATGLFTGLLKSAGLSPGIAITAPAVSVVSPLPNSLPPAALAWPPHL